jgi:hypothetical protein
MPQRFGTVFAIAIGTTVFGTYGSLASPAAVTAGFKPALWACSVFAVLGALAATAMSARRKPAAEVDPIEAELTGVPAPVSAVPEAG